MSGARQTTVAPAAGVIAGFLAELRAQKSSMEDVHFQAWSRLVIGDAYSIYIYSMQVHQSRDGFCYFMTTGSAEETMDI